MTQTTYVVERPASGCLGTLGNVLWLLIVGWSMFLGYLLAALLSVVFIVTIPFAVPCTRMAVFSLWPFGRRVVQQADAGAPSTIANVVWWVLIGWWLALGQIVAGLLLCLTIIGIPFGIQCFKLAGLAWWPFGKDIVRG
jgi:uncharacterized membrane protein YccF (DUF307 family)